MKTRTEKSSGLAFDCDALKPLHERNASYKFRRCARYPRMELAELTAFLAIVPVHWARWIFAWTPKTIPRDLPAALPWMVEANREGLSVDVGLAVLRAMQEGGWKHGRLPDVTARALREMRHSGGLSYGEIGRRVGLTENQVRWAVAERGKAKKTKQNSAFLKILTA